MPDTPSPKQAIVPVPAGLRGIYLIIMAVSAIGIVAVFLLNVFTPLPYVNHLSRDLLQGGPSQIVQGVLGRLVVLAAFTILASLPLAAILRWYLAPLSACLAAWRSDEQPPAEAFSLAQRRTLNLPFVFIAMIMANWLVISAVLTIVVHALVDVGTNSAVAVGARTSMVGLVSASVAFFWLEAYCRRRFVPLLFPRGRLTRVPGAARLSISRRVRAVYRVSSLVPMFILLVTLVTLQWEVDTETVTAKEYGQGILIFCLVLTAMFFVIGGVINRMVTASITRPLQNLLAMVARVANGDYGTRARVVSNDEIGALGDAGNAMITGLAERKLLRETLGKYVTPQIRDEILSGRVPLDGETRRVTVLFADLRGFTPLVAATPAKQLVWIINGYFESMSQAVHDNGGLVLQYIGDEIEAVFGAPVDLEKHPAAAARAALDMRQMLAVYNRELAASGVAPLAHGIGICTGQVLVANIGSTKRLSYAMLGDAVNMASRLQELTKTLGYDILISGETAAGLEEEFEIKPLPPMTIRGKAEPMDLCALLG